MGQGAYIVAPAGPVLTEDEVAFFRDADPFGFILFARNAETPEQLRRLCTSLREAVGREAPILIDQEGGRVQRLRAPHWREWMPPLDQVAALTPHESAAFRAMHLRGLMIGAELRAQGIDANCAPSADIAWPETHPFLRNRCYGTDAATVTAMARACATGLLEAGVLPVLKHAPGHGRATLDSHLALPRIDVPLAELRDTDFAPFRALADLPMAMTAHIVLPEIDAETPVTLSPAGVRFLREDLGLQNFLMTDDISMQALSGDIAERAARAIAAGCDAVLHCNGDLSEMRVIAETVGAMDGASQHRADIALTCRAGLPDIDISALEAEFGALMQGRAHA
ncbi:glycoside hydrolase family 3 protein [Silicimonas algicola]|uniref:beta-N-acetylhexosaminidase n=1 Tax=Silicimonas algicola TaxID=1826607 RepID=A0A316G794_9RHOB|nr:glycoside hydrolase family 3 N-terminal domain-containing protein [Silicimonas algicola]AZQ67173.1 glycoside hydrolase family 3 protein [Silicimonas algicola]PWK56821.1 beta-N-acetylhexosaminidase [Silicimonas algicola]